MALGNFESLALIHMKTPTVSSKFSNVHSEARDARALLGKKTTLTVELPAYEDSIIVLHY